MKIRADYVAEPDLIFGYSKEEKDPKLGLMHFGPYFSTDEGAPSPSQIRVGIIGNAITIGLTKKILELLGNAIESSESNKWLYPDFPGFRLDNNIKCGFTFSDIWTETITEYEIKRILEIADVNERISAASDVFVEKIAKIMLEDSLPHVIICALPMALEEYCGISRKTRGAKRPKFTKGEMKLLQLKAQGQTLLTEWGMEIDETAKPIMSYDFRNALKGKAMKFNIPTQLLRETVAKSILDYPESKEKVRQAPATFAWNLSTGLYYKAHGRPWRLAKLTHGTCYVGISFYRRLLNPALNLETSMAQVFTHTGNGFVLRGSDVVKDEQSRQPHLSMSDAYLLLLNSINKYTDKAGGPPNRVVIHKTSFFSEDEKQGFDKAIGKIPRDFVSISKNTDLRFLRTGIYPVLRGTLISLTSNEHLLYTSGYTPRVRTYPGLRIPLPLLIHHEGDSETKLICNEILGLTKLNWNTTAFSTQLPITLEFARKVGRVLSEISDEIKLQDHYRFYM